MMLERYPTVSFSGTATRSEGAKVEFEGEITIKGRRAAGDTHGHAYRPPVADQGVTRCLLTFPVIIGQETRLFADTGPDVALDLVDTRTTPNG